VTASAAGPARVGPARDAGNRLLLVILFWALYATSVALWWFNTPPGTIGDRAGALTAIGRITGLLGGYLLLVQVLLSSRVAWLEGWIGARDLLNWHRCLGGLVPVVVLGHVVSTVLAYALSDGVSPLAGAVRMLTTLDDMLSATIATGLLVAICLLAIRGIRRRLPYELWQALHRVSYLVLLLGYGHQVALGADLQSTVAALLWAGMYWFVAACLVWGRLVEPGWLNLRHRLRVLGVVAESDTMFSIYITGRRLDRLGARAGQYFRWRFLTRGCWWQAHPFSLSAAPNGRWLRLTVNVVGEHTARLRETPLGTRVLVTGPTGTFTAGRRTRSAAVLIAAGSGIAPIRALAEVMPTGTALIYRASTPDDLVFRPELAALARRRGIDVRYVVGSRHDPGPRHLFTPAGMRALVPDVRSRDVYLCGPSGLISHAVATLRRLRVPKRQIHLDPFEL
jgi:predicted ferric reductase